MKVLNLTFHGIGKPVRLFEEGEEALWSSVGLFRNTLNLIEDENFVRLTFDDGNDSDITEALPELLRRNMKAVFFVVAGRIGQKGYVSGEALKDIVGAGMEVGSHGMHHTPWRGMATSELSSELEVARDRIEQIIGRAVTKAACPFGAYDRKVLGSLRRVRYDRIYTSDRGWADEHDWLQVRNSIHASDSPAQVQELINGKRSCGMTRTIKLALKRWR